MKNVNKHHIEKRTIIYFEISRKLKINDQTSAVRETGISRHHGDHLTANLKHLSPSQHYSIGGFQGAPKLVPHYALDARLRLKRMSLFMTLKKYINF